MDKENDKVQTAKRRTDKKVYKNKNKLDRILNYLIVLVSIMIVITAVYIFTFSEDTKSPETEQTATTEDAKSDEPQASTTEQSASEADVSTEEQKPSEIEKQTEPTNQQPEPTEQQPIEEQQTNDDNEANEVTESASTDSLVEKVIVNENWKPIGTTQTGLHTSQYDEESVDWQEKVSTLLNTAGLSENQAIIWSVKNNGSGQTSIGVISSKDKKQKYRISIEWVDNERWKPVKMEILNKLEGTY